MYGFGFQQVYEVEQFLRLFGIVHRRLHLSSRTIIQSGLGYNKRRLSISSTKSQPPYPISMSTAITPNKNAHTTLPFLNDSLRREMSLQADVNVHHIEKGLQGLSFASDASRTAPNFNLASSSSKQTSMDASSLHCGDSITFDPNSNATRPVEQKQYQLWSAPPWNALLEHRVYNNQASIASAWDSLLNH
ncbi:unnamed protein product [Cercopithifilaria johnstoni]|uniref:Uncharacterized protein n=1 Tax=Cercopithifilaria johnstoni TaxID=2874296 RepID=A0A8J2LWY8_9BILA|nr:unnamed protein product [Cercopithifilaria johnstoni]